LNLSVATSLEKQASHKKGSESE